jgi:predicted amidohydrolase
MTATAPGTESAGGRREDAEATTAPQPQDAHAKVSGDGGVVVALAQIAPHLGDVPRNLQRHLATIEAARQGGAHLVVFPELSLTGYFLKDLVPDVAVRLDSPEVGELAAASAGLDVVVGAVLETEEARFHNAALYFSDGRLHHVHRKVYLPTYGLFDEQRYFAQGDRFRTFDAPLSAARQPRPWHAGLLICEDMWHMTAPSLLARQGVDVLLCPSSSPGRGVTHGTALGTALSYDAMTRTFAQLTTSYVLYCNRVGYEDGVHFWGGSRVVDPDGKVCVEAGDTEELIWSRIDLHALRRVRLAYPLLRDERHDITDAETDRLRHLRMSEQP